MKRRKTEVIEDAIRDLLGARYSYCWPCRAQLAWGFEFNIGDTWYTGTLSELEVRSAVSVKDVAILMETLLERMGIDRAEYLRLRCRRAA